MTKIKISMFALAFVLATGASLANSSLIEDGWYQPDISNPGSRTEEVPSNCDDGPVLCATLYIDDEPVQQAFKQNNP